MAACKLLGDADKCFRIGKGKPHLLFGGVHLILIGDFYQLPPVNGKKLFMAETKSGRPYTDSQNQGRSAYLSLTTFVEFIHNYRTTDSIYIKYLSLIRKGIATEEVSNYLNSKLIREKDLKSSWESVSQQIQPNALCVASTREMCSKINTLVTNSLITHENRVCYITFYKIKPNSNEIYLYIIKVVYCWAIHRRPGVRHKSTKKTNRQLNVENEDDNDDFYRIQQEDYEKSG